jgi:hypothetical protein
MRYKKPDNLPELTVQLVSVLSLVLPESLLSSWDAAPDMLSESGMNYRGQMARA